MDPSPARTGLGRLRIIEQTAIIVSHGQPSDPLPAEADLAELSVRVALQLPGWRVASATLAHPGALEGVLASVDGTSVIYPLFMTDGWFVRSALPKRLGAAPVHILPPLGAEPGLPELVAERLDDELRRRGWMSAETTLLVASHGSGRSRNSKLATEAFVANLAARIGFEDIRTGYVEEPPFIGETFMGAPGQTLCLPFFAAYGGHVKEDIVSGLRAADFKGVLLDPVGTFDAVPTLVAGSLRSAYRG